MDLARPLQTPGYLSKSDLARTRHIKSGRNDWYPGCVRGSFRGVGTVGFI